MTWGVTMFNKHKGFYTVYHDVDVVSKEYHCTRVEYRNDTVILHNVSGDVVATTLFLSLNRGDVRVLELAA